MPFSIRSLNDSRPRASRGVDCTLFEVIASVLVLSVKVWKVDGLVTRKEV